MTTLNFRGLWILKFRGLWARSCTISWNFMRIFTFIHSFLCYNLYCLCKSFDKKNSWAWNYVKYYFSSLDVISTFLLQRTVAIIELLMTTLRKVLRNVICVTSFFLHLTSIVHMKRVQTLRRMIFTSVGLFCLFQWTFRLH